MFVEIAVASLEDLEDLWSIDLDRFRSPVDRSPVVVAFLRVPADRQVEAGAGGSSFWFPRAVASRSSARSPGLPSYWAIGLP